MDSQVETQPAFEVLPSAEGYGDWLSPPSPFAQLLHGAFGNHLDASDFKSQSERWHQVFDAVGSRYRLWQ